MRISTLLPLTLACVLAPLPAQVHPFGGVLLVRHGAGDLVLNKPLLDMLLYEPALRVRLREACGEAPNFRGIQCDLPAAHLPGTFQVHLRGEAVAETWDEALRDKAVDAVAAHLRERLSLLLFEQPHAELTRRSLDLRHRCRMLAAERSTDLQGREQAAAQVAMLEQQQLQLEQQKLTAQIDLATERRALTRLQELVETHRRVRDAGAARTTDHASRVQQIELLAGERDLVHAKLQQHPDDPALLQQRDDLQRVVTELSEELSKARRERSVEDLRGQDAQRLLVVTLEQLPLTMLSQQRAESRMASISDQELRVLQELQRARDMQAKARAETEAVEQMTIELTVCRSLLTEVQGKLERLEPVRVELLAPF